jgi:hypothetical protein
MVPTWSCGARTSRRSADARARPRPGRTLRQAARLRCLFHAERRQHRADRGGSMPGMAGILLSTPT